MSLKVSHGTVADDETKENGDVEFQKESDGDAVTKKGRGRPRKHIYLLTRKHKQPSVEDADQVKRGRGRPPKERTESSGGDDDDDDGEPKVKRGRGRPPKEHTETTNGHDGDDDGEPKVKRGRGRPPKASLAKRGRPAKVAAAADDVSNDDS